MVVASRSESYTEYERDVLNQLSQAWEAYANAKTAQDQLQMGESLKSVLRTLTELISQVRVPDNGETGGRAPR